MSVTWRICVRPAAYQTVIDKARPLTVHSQTLTPEMEQVSKWTRKRCAINPQATESWRGARLGGNVISPRLTSTTKQKTVVELGNKRIKIKSICLRSGLQALSLKIWSYHNWGVPWNPGEDYNVKVQIPGLDNNKENHKYTGDHKECFLLMSSVDGVLCYILFLIYITDEGEACWVHATPVVYVYAG